MSDRNKNKTSLKDKIKEKLVALGIVATTIAPVSNVNASNETFKDGEPISSVGMQHYNNVTVQNEGDSILSSVRYEGFMLYGNNNDVKGYYQQAYERTDVLDNGYSMVYNSYDYYKNGNIRKYDRDYVLHTPEGKEINCNFLNKFDFTSEGSVTDIETGNTTNISKEYAEKMNELVEKKANIEIMKRIKDPEDRNAVKQYVHRKRMEQDNLMNVSHTVDVYVASLNEYDEYSSKDSKEIKKTAKKYEQIMNKSVRDFRE